MHKVQPYSPGKRFAFIPCQPLLHLFPQSNGIAGSSIRLRLCASKSAAGYPGKGSISCLYLHLQQRAIFCRTEPVFQLHTVLQIDFNILQLEMIRNGIQRIRIKDRHISFIFKTVKIVRRQLPDSAFYRFYLISRIIQDIFILRHIYYRLVKRRSIPVLLTPGIPCHTIRRLTEENGRTQRRRVKQVTPEIVRIGHRYVKNPLGMSRRIWIMRGIQRHIRKFNIERSFHRIVIRNQRRINI